MPVRLFLICQKVNLSQTLVRGIYNPSAYTRLSHICRDCFNLFKVEKTGVLTIYHYLLPGLRGLLDVHGQLFFFEAFHALRQSSSTRRKQNYSSYRHCGKEMKPSLLDFRIFVLNIFYPILYSSVKLSAFATLYRSFSKLFRSIIKFTLLCWSGRIDECSLRFIVTAG